MSYPQAYDMLIFDVNVCSVCETTKKNHQHIEKQISCERAMGEVHKNARDWARIL